MDRGSLLNVVNIIANYFAINHHSVRFESNEELFAAIDEALRLMPFIKADPEMLAEIRNEMQYRYQVKNADPGHSIQFDYDAPKWYSKKIEQEGFSTEFWDRYKNYLLNKKGFSVQVVDDLEKKTLNAELMNFLADPDGASDRPKRGLIIGDVQSGKTSTYTGLICKAADAGYRVFIILTGMIESLRVQTQQRIEEGFIGFDMSDPKNTRCGVGEDNKPIRVASITSRKADFTRNSDLIALSLQSCAAVVFVLKKNTSVLTKLISWLKKSNIDAVHGKVMQPMLLIDDEADNASINTSAHEDPTRINGLIRTLIELFDISNYVGFTATPFANVFIDPLTVDEMFSHDLFPEDFIVALPTPEDYVGPAKIFHPDGQYHKQLIYIEDAGVREEDGFPFWYLHHKNWDGTLPDSLTDALYAFYIVNAIRDLRGDTDQHRTMMVNMTRFTAVQYKIRDKVARLHKAALRAIRFNLDPNDPLSSDQDPCLKRIHELFDQQFADAGFSWEQVASALWDAVEGIELKVINSSRNSDKLIYPDDEPQRVIAIGGLALSRGLTLEGLIVSYFYRNTSTYDVLMQMGRWFGYRRGYEDLFRIWISKQSADWYSEISDAADELKSDMDTMRERHQRPREFGIRVRDDSDKLEITARNKMRNAGIEYEYTSYYGSCIETPFLSANAAEERENYELVCKFVRGVRAVGISPQLAEGQNSKRYVLTKVPLRNIVTLLSNIRLPACNKNFDPQQIVDFLAGINDPLLNLWDVVFISGNEKQVEIEGMSIPMVKRSNCSINGDKLNVGKRQRLGSTKDGLTGLINDDLRKKAEEAFRQEYLKRNGMAYTANSFTSDTWFRYISTEERRPLLMLYPLKVEPTKNDPEFAKDFPAFFEALGDIPVFGFAMGFPRSQNQMFAEKSRYRVNRQYNFYEDDIDIDDEDGEE